LTVSVRPAVAADATAISALVTSAFTPYVDRIGREPAPMTVDYAAAVRAGHTWVARSGDELVGMVFVVPAADHVLIDTIAVANNARGLGIGATLLDVAEAEARRLGLPQVRLYTNEAMTENLTYYPRRGFRETHRARTDDFDRVYFAKTVT
jgi:N-acetylglutamate synthase-like GNAT family acetyltransferase